MRVVRGPRHLRHEAAVVRLQRLGAPLPAGQVVVGLLHLAHQGHALAQEPLRLAAARRRRPRQLLQLVLCAW